MTTKRKCLTEASVLTLELKPKAYRAWDKYHRESVAGLHVLVQTSGTKSYRVSYKLQGQVLERSLHLGRVGEMSLADARDKAREVIKAAAKGIDLKSQDPKLSEKFKACVETWTTKEQIGRKARVSAKAVERFVLSSTKQWHDRSAGTLRPKEIEDLLEAKRDAGKKYAANQLYAHLKTMFRYLAKKGIVQVDPMLKVDKPWNGAKRRQRNWFAGTKGDDAVLALWRTAERLGDDGERYIKMLLITGKRRGAVEDMRWDDIDRDHYWQPPQRSTFKRNNPIVLPKLARQVLGERQDSGRVLTINRREVIAFIRDHAGLDGFLIHGIKHLVSTKLKELKVHPYIARQICDHAAFSDVHSGYEHSDDREDMLAALEKWCGHIDRLLKRSNLNGDAPRLMAAE